MSLKEVQAQNLAQISGSSKESGFLWGIGALVVITIGLMWLLSLVLDKAADRTVPLIISVAIASVPAFYVGREISVQSRNNAIEASKCRSCGVELSEQLIDREEHILATTPKHITVRDSKGVVTHEEHWTDVHYHFMNYYQRACCGTTYTNSGNEIRKENLKRFNKRM